MRISKKTVLSVSLFTLLLWGVVLSTFATPPTSPYTVSDNITDPSCAPNSANCYVSVVTADNGLTATGSNVQLGGVLLQDTNIDLDTFNLGINTPSPDHQFQITGTFKNEYTDGTGVVSTIEAGDNLLGFGLVGNMSSVYDPITTGLTAFTLNTISSDNGGLVQNLIGGIDASTGNNFFGFENSVGTDESSVYLGSGSGNSSARIAILRELLTGYSRARIENTNFISGLSSTINNDADTGIMFDFGGVDGFYTFPRVDGTTNQVLTTDGSGQLSWETPSGGGGSGWSLTGNSGTTAGTNFIGTTDTEDFMVKTNGNQVALFGQNGNVAIGSSVTLPFFGLLPEPVSSGIGSIAIGPASLALGDGSTAVGIGSIASGFGSLAFIGGEATGIGSVAFGGVSTGQSSFAWGTATASGNNSTAWAGGSGDSSTEASGDNSTAWGYGMLARAVGETAFGFFGTDYTSETISDRLLTIGNGSEFSRHNAYTLWQDGSFAYNDDNFQNDNPGTEQNMFYFNYGNHDGLGTAQTKRAIRLGSAFNGEWDITAADVGDRSIAIGFAISGSSVIAPTASGIGSVAFGPGNVVSGDYGTSFGVINVVSGENAMSWGQLNTTSNFRSTAWGENNTSSAVNSTVWGDGNTASGSEATAFGHNTSASGSASTSFGQGSTASGIGSVAFGTDTIASGNFSTAFGVTNFARSDYETVFGLWATDYIPVGGLTDRLLNIGNGTGIGSETDAFTILKNGETGIAIDNFEANTNGNIFQVGDGATNIIGYVDDTTGNWVAVSDERKKDNITDLTYGLDQVLQLRPTSFNYKRNGEHTIGFIAQQVLPIIPESVYGSESEGYGMSYATLTPVLVSAIQEINFNITKLSDETRTNTWRDALIEWFASSTNGIRSLVVRDKICVDDQCLTKDDIKVLLELKNSTTPVSPTPTPTPTPSPSPDPLTCTAPQILNQTGDVCIDPVVVNETPIETPPADEPPAPIEE